MTRKHLDLKGFNFRPPFQAFCETMSLVSARKKRNKKVIAKKPLTNLYEMNSKYIEKVTETEPHRIVLRYFAIF